MDTKINSYKDLTVWQKSIELVLCIYTLTEDFPKQEQYGLMSQMRRASVSIPSNIAEGSKRGSRKDYKKFIRNSFGSGAELETQLILAQKLDFCTNRDLENTQELLDSIMKMLNSLIKSLEKQNL
jgi:four helix bundle protein